MLQPRAILLPQLFPHQLRKSQLHIEPAKFTCTHLRAQKHAQICKHTVTQTRKHTNTQTHIHTHTHTRVRVCLFVRLSKQQTLVAARALCCRWWIKNFRMQQQQAGQGKFLFNFLAFRVVIPRPLNPITPETSDHGGRGRPRESEPAQQFAFFQAAGASVWL